MESQSIVQDKIVGVPDADFLDALEEFPFVDASNSFEEFDQSFSSSESDSSNDEETTVTFISDHTPDSPSSPSSAGLRHRRIISTRGSKELSQSQFFKNNPDGLVDFHPHATSASSAKKHRRLPISKDNEKFNEILNSSLVHLSSGSDGSQLNNDTSASSSITSANGRERFSDESTSVDSPNSAPDLLHILAELAFKVISFQTKFLTSPVTFPIWLLHSSYLLFTDPYGIFKVGRSYVLGNTSGIWGIGYSVVKLINYLWSQKHDSTLKFCFRIGWGLLWFAYCGSILVCLLVPAFLFSGMMTKWIVEDPVQITEKLTFDYTKDTPMAFVPVISCPESSSSLPSETPKFGNSAKSRVIPYNHEVQATVSLTLPESDYNINLGIFQVRVDFLSRDGKLLASTRKPCMLQFKSQPIRLVSTFFNLVSLVTGYSSETQTLDINFRGYTEKRVPTSCSRVVIEQRAEFLRRGGVPEIYSASLKLESQLPYVKRVLWYSKWLIFIWISMTVYVMELLFTLLCCRPVIFPWERGSGVSSNQNASRNEPSG